jgi:HSP20 family molecular chaperone IbpA
MQRSFYVGEGLDENDVKAKFEDGVLRLCFPKEKEPELPEKKTIMIEG